MQQLLCLLFFLSFVYAQGDGLSCPTAINVELDSTQDPFQYTFDIDASTNRGFGYFCNETYNPDAGAAGVFVTAARIFKVTTRDTAYSLTVSTCGSSANNGWAIMTTPTQGCVPNQFTVCWMVFTSPTSTAGCVEESAMGSKAATYPLGKNQVYYFSAFGTTFYGGTGFGTIVATLSFTEIGSPMNDGCERAIAITPRAYITGTTDGAGPSPPYTDFTACPEYSTLTALSPDVWYSFNSGNSPAAYIYSCGGFPTNFISYFYLSTGCDDPAGTCLAYVSIQDGDCPSLTGGGNLYYPSLAPNTEYLISVSGLVGTLGDFFFFLHLADDNAKCSAAVEITSLSFTYSGSVDAAPEDEKCSGNRNAVFFKLNSGRGIYGLTLDACNANFDAVISITASCDTYDCMVEEESGCGGANGARLSNVQLPANTEVYIRLASKSFSLNTTYTLSVTGSYTDLNLDCASPQVVSSVPYSFSGSTAGAQMVALCGAYSTASWFSFNTGGGFPSLTLTATAEFQPSISILSSCGGQCLPVSGTDTITLQNVAANQQLLIAVTGGEGQYTFSISGTSFQAPVIICPSDIVVTASPTTCRYSGTTGTPSLISLDGSGTSFSKSPRAPYSIGVTNVVYTATNSNNGRFTSSCTQQVTVRRPANSGC